MSHTVVFTITAGNAGENHKGMEMLGTQLQEGSGHSVADLERFDAAFKAVGATTNFVRLNCGDLPPAAVLVIKGGVDVLLKSKTGSSSLFAEQAALTKDTKALMRGKVVNKHARHNLCFDRVGHAADFAAGKGTVVAYDDVPHTKALVEAMAEWFTFEPRSAAAAPSSSSSSLSLSAAAAEGAAAASPAAPPRELIAEGNYYYDLKRCGIGFHGDKERVVVYAARLGASMPLHFQWFHRSLPVGERIIIPLDGGDVYVMSEKAVGADWMHSSKLTLRHATGCAAFTTIKKKEGAVAARVPGGAKASPSAAASASAAAAAGAGAPKRKAASAAAAADARAPKRKAAPAAAAAADANEEDKDVEERGKAADTKRVAAHGGAGGGGGGAE